MRYKDETRMTKERMQKLTDINSDWQIDFYSKTKKNSAYFLEMKCKTCGLVSQFSISGIATGGIRCQNCINSKLADNFDRLGFEYFGRTGGRCFIGCNGCETVVIRQNIDYSKRSKIDCPTCHTRLITDILERNGCALLEQYMECGETRVKYLTLDGKENTVAAKQIKGGYFAKTKEIESSYSVYMFWRVIENSDVIPDGLYFKIGIAIDPNFRLKVLNLDFDCKIHIMREALGRKEAQKIEKEMHNMFWWCKLDKTIPEIFTNRRSYSKLSNKNKKKRHHMKDGATEWFFLPENIFNLMLRNKESFKCT